MDKKHIIGLTNIVYRLTLLFPKKEPLRYKMRETADDILEQYSTKQNMVKNLEVLDMFFEVAKAQNWVKQDELLEIQKAYDNIKREIKNVPVNNPPAKENQIQIKQVESKQNGFTMPERQEKILAFLREHGRAQVWQIKEILPEVTKRTLRRDFEALLKQGLIERIGERNKTFYQIKTL